MNIKKMCGFLCMLGLMSFSSWTTYRIYNYEKFKVNCAEYLTLATYAATPEEASTHLNKAIEYIDLNDLGYGSTSILYYSPDDDLKLWRERLKETKVMLTSNEITPATFPFVTQQLHNTLNKIPNGVSVKGNNILVAIWGFVSIAFASIYLYLYRKE